MSDSAGVSSSVAPLKKKWTGGYVVMFVLLIGLLISYFDRSNVTVLLADPTFLKDNGLTGRPDLQGLIMTSFIWTYGVGALCLGFVLDKLGARKALTFMSIAWAFAMVVGGISNGLNGLLGSRVLLGIGEGVQMPTNMMLAKNWATPRERGIANAIWGAGMPIGMALTMPVVVWIVTASGWRMSFFVLAVLSILVLIPVWIFIRNHPKESPFVSKEELTYVEAGLEAEKAAFRARGAGDPAKDWSTTLKSLDYWLQIVCAMTIGAMFWGLISWLPTYLKAVRGFTWAELGMMSSMPYILGTVVIILGGIVMMRVRRMAFMVWTGCIIFAVFMALAIVTDSNMMSAVFISLGFCGIMWAFSAHYSLTQKIVSHTVIGKASGLQLALFQFFSGFIPYIIGWLVATSGGSFTPGLVLLIGLSIIGGIAAFIMYTREGRTFGVPFSAQAASEKA